MGSEVRLQGHVKKLQVKRRYRTNIKHAVDVVDISVFPSTMMNVILGHRDFRSIEYGRLGRLLILEICLRKWEHLVHIIPDVNGIRTLGPRPPTLHCIWFEKALPPIPSLRVEEIDPRAAA